MISDWEWYDRARGGDEGAWRILFHRYHPPLVRMTSVITGSVDAGRDLAQECFLRLFRGRPPHREGSFRSYITTIAYRLALKEKRRFLRHTRFAGDELRGDLPTPLESAVRRDRAAAVSAVLRTLPDEQRDVLALRFHGGHSYEEIAEITGVPLGTVKSRIFHAVKACRKQFAERGITA